MNRALWQCQKCRHGLLDSFASLAGISIQPLSTTRKSTLSRPHIPPSAKRSITTSFPSQQNEASDAQTSSATSTTSQNASLPWYLQVETPSPPVRTSPHLALQEIPPVPSDAPQILSPILNHLSTQIGLDNLALLDLRHLVPPPALGANLIMIIGTARSYKHLNTSADRFCRWIRSRYKLSPFADGLLGRNEMKLKLRRKARKMKLAQSVGNTVAMNNADDGITTGWICVNLGTVDNARIPVDEKIERDGALSEVEQEEVEADEEEYQNPENRNGGYVGFGSRSTAPRIVVQMFVEEKRIEMDLEGLWDYRQERRAQKAERGVAETRQSLQSDTATIETEEGASVFKPWTQ